MYKQRRTHNEHHTSVKYSFVTLNDIKQIGNKTNSLLPNTFDQISN